MHKTARISDTTGWRPQSVCPQEPGLDLGLLMSYITPMGPGVTEACSNSSALYIRRLMEVTIALTI